MVINAYFRRSFGRRQSSSASFSSTSFSSTDDPDHDTNDHDHDVYAKVSDNGKRYKRQTRPSWWKWSSSRSKSKREERKTKQQTQNKDEGNRKNDENRDDFNDKDSQPPPILSLASPELQEAVRYFEIGTKDAFTKEFVKKKYKRLSLIHHPDRNGNEETSIREMQKINYCFELLEEELDRRKVETTSAEKVDGGVDNLPVTPTSNRRCGVDNYNGNNDEVKNTYAKRGRRPSHHRRRSSFVFRPRSSTTDTSQGCESSHSKKQHQHATTRHRKKRRLLEHPIADPLVDIVLCVLVGRFVTCSGWVTSQVIIALAYGAPRTATATTTTAAARPSKTLFFALHTGWYILTGILSRGMDLIEALGDGIPVPWQLQLVGGATAVSMLVEQKHYLQRPLQWLANAVVEAESALMVGFDWILLSREKIKTLLVDFPTSEHYYVQTIVDFVVLSIPILAVRLLLYCY